MEGDMDGRMKDGLMKGGMEGGMDEGIEDEWMVELSELATVTNVGLGTFLNIFLKE